MKRTVPFCCPLCPGRVSDGDVTAGLETLEGVLSALESRSLGLRLLRLSSAGDEGDVPFRLAGDLFTPFVVLFVAAFGEAAISASEGDSVKRGNRLASHSCLRSMVMAMKVSRGVSFPTVVMTRKCVYMSSASSKVSMGHDVSIQ